MPEGNKRMTKQNQFETQIEGAGFYKVPKSPLLETQTASFLKIPSEPFDSILNF